MLVCLITARTMAINGRCESIVVPTSTHSIQCSGYVDMTSSSRSVASDQAMHEQIQATWFPSHDSALSLFNTSTLRYMLSPIFYITTVR